MNELVDNKVTIDDKVILFRIPRLFREGMGAAALLETMRRAWIIGERRNRAQYALSVVKKRVVGVFTIQDWHRAQGVGEIGRWEFTGETAPEDIRKKYLGKDMSGYLSGRNPVIYVNC